MVALGPAAESFAAALAAPGWLAAENDVPSALDNTLFGERELLVIGKAVDDGDHIFGAALQTGGRLPTEKFKEANTDNVVVHGRSRMGSMRTAEWLWMHGERERRCAGNVNEKVGWISTLA